ncbi:MAG TPA: hypothetical protein VMA36_11290 [Candidatus Limnocylindria bacterium]|jgi:Cu/Zn superoxide dismutase|nr:hypothetical protein [Candidatus Limnocylindria bacterium]
MRPLIAVLAAAAVSAGGTLASAQTSSQSAARAATQNAQKVTRQIEERHHSGMGGTVELRPVGNQTEVLVSLRSATQQKEAITLHKGSDCQDGRFATQADVALAPMNSAGVNAPQSRTLINLPIQKVSSDYVVDVRNATQSAQFAEACAHLHGK